ncbi:hypothetical protein PRK78_007010 [Emydomyces testavorans]|uniref:Uncharacterized protein n=1 Tax=Emydomyces testavorans TaxID=2070801 RepID=A0AAF0DR97_9EURO|nr:hypothetical protein PRK78_007010 [Emydomyces testavorans]
MATVLGRRCLVNSYIALKLWTCGSCRRISRSSLLQSGHSKWANIKHKKGRNDAAKSKERLVICQELTQASKLYGADPGCNPKLAAAIANAKRSEMTKATIEFAIAKGQRLSTSGAPLEPLTIEALLPGSVAVVIECQTDQRTKTLQSVRRIVKRAGGNLAPTTYLFEKKGKIVFEKDPKNTSADDYLESAIDAGATDVDTDSEGRLVVYTEPTVTKSVGETLSTSTGLKIENLDIIWDPNKDTMVTVLTEEAANELDQFLDDIREETTVQEVYLNLART